MLGQASSIAMAESCCALNDLKYTVSCSSTGSD